jgi:outer membrane protein TolC
MMQMDGPKLMRRWFARRYAQYLTVGLGLAAVIPIGCRAVDSAGLEVATAEQATLNSGFHPENGATAAPTGGEGTSNASFDSLAAKNRSAGKTVWSAPMPSLTNSVRPDPPSTAGLSSRQVTVDLGVALHLAGVANPTINLAREQISEALAAELVARSLLLPSVNIGGNYRIHRGAFQDDPGPILKVNSQSLYLGAGAGAVGTGTVAFPGVWLFAHLGDAVYEPVAARQRVSARGSDAQAVQNAVLLNVATAYLTLVGAEARQDILKQAEADVNEIVRITTAFAGAGEGRPADANRATANAELVREEIRTTDGEVVAASARLSQLITLDPAVAFHTPGGPVEPFRLIAEDADTEALVAVAVRSRPEIFSRSAEIQEAQTRVRQERVRPCLPLIAVGYSAGLFGGGSNQVPEEFGPLKGRSDFSAIAVWNIQNLGVGSGARVHRATAVVGQAVASYETTVNQIRREVAEAQALCKTAARQIEVARKAVTIAEQGFQLETDRIRQGRGRPIEALDSFHQLLDSRQELLRAIIAFDVAQFHLFVALGNTPALGITPESASGPSRTCSVP